LLARAFFLFVLSSGCV